MNKYIIQTQVDITRTRPQRDDPDEIKQSQQANFNSLRQAIELRANISDDTNPVRKEGKFPDGLKGSGVWWEYTFTVEREMVYDREGDPVALLREDLNGVPIISGLNNSVEFDLNVFNTRGEKINTIVVFSSPDDK